MTANVLLIEDDEEVATRCVEKIAAISGRANCVHVVSSAAARKKLQSEFFDLAILDLKIPSTDQSHDDDFSHGQALFYVLRESYPGLPIVVLTSTPADDFIDELQDNNQSVDVWGSGHKVPTVRFVPKRKIDQFSDRVRVAIESCDEFRHLEVDAPAGLLCSSRKRLVQIFLRRHGAVRAEVAPLSGGLSDALVLRVKAFGIDGALRHHVVAKIGPPADIELEGVNYAREVARLKERATPRLIESLKFGGMDQAAVFYGLAEEFPYTVFNFDPSDEGGFAALVKSVVDLLAPWSNDVPSTQVSVGDIRRVLLSDEESADIVARLNIPWAAGFENTNVQARMCTIHGDLHGGNVLVSTDGVPILIDYGDVCAGPAALDAVSFELGRIFHPEGDARRAGADVDVAKLWSEPNKFGERLGKGDFVVAAREWAESVAGAKREVLACAYAYVLRQAKYGNVSDEVIREFLVQFRDRFEEL